VFVRSLELAQVLGQVDNILILEKEIFEVLIHDLKSHFQIEKSVRLILDDYHTPKSLDAVRIKTQDGVSIIVLS